MKGIFLKKVRNEAEKLLPYLFTVSLCRYLELASDFMKTPPRRDRSRATARPNQAGCRTSSGSVGRWAFNLASENLFALGSTDAIRRVAYRTADGHLRFLPL